MTPRFCSALIFSQWEKAKRVCIGRSAVIIEQREIVYHSFHLLHCNKDRPYCVNRLFVLREIDYSFFTEYLSSLLLLVIQWVCVHCGVVQIQWDALWSLSEIWNDSDTIASHLGLWVINVLPQGHLSSILWNSILDMKFHW